MSLPQHVSPPTAPGGTVEAARACVNCGESAPGPYCAACGQPERPARLRLRDVTRRLVGDALDLDRGILHTAVALFRRPGAVVRDYLRGRTIPFTNPVKYFLLSLSVVQLAALWSGATGDFAAGFTGAADDATGGAAAGLTELLDRFFPLLAAPAVPVLAAAQRLLFRRTGRNYAEQLVVALYLAAQQLLVLLPLVLVGGRSKSDAVVTLALLSLAAAVGYHVWASRQAFGLSWGGTLVRSLAAQLLTALAYATLLGATLAVLGALAAAP